MGERVFSLVSKERKRVGPPSFIMDCTIAASPPNSHSLRQSKLAFRDTVYRYSNLCAATWQCWFWYRFLVPQNPNVGFSVTLLRIGIQFVVPVPKLKFHKPESWPSSILLRTNTQILVLVPNTKSTDLFLVFKSRFLNTRELTSYYLYCIPVPKTQYRYSMQNLQLW